jgi:hypothetical protein
MPPISQMAIKISKRPLLLIDFPTVSKLSLGPCNSAIMGIQYSNDPCHTSFFLYTITFRSPGAGPQLR